MPIKYPEGRTTISITITPENLQKARNLNLNISRICDMAIAQAINAPHPNYKHIEKQKSPAELIQEVLPIRAVDAMALLMEKTAFGKEKVKRIIRERNGILWKQGPGPDHMLEPLVEGE